jgi:hypothetical protein
VPGDMSARSAQHRAECRIEPRDRERQILEEDTPSRIRLITAVERQCDPTLTSVPAIRATRVCSQHRALSDRRFRSVLHRLAFLASLPGPWSKTT